jgi:orotidine-5'-phosphate decarboxylase
VGLDTDAKKIPAIFQNSKKPLFEFNKAIIDATHDLVCAYKPQIAYYAAQAAEDELQMTIDYIKRLPGGIPVILDAKRGDIGETAAMYAREAFERYGAHAVTVNPYMGGDTLRPFLEYRDRGVIILCKTSNPGSGELQNLATASGQAVYEIVAQKAATEWNTHGNVALVTGGTHVAEIAKVRALCGDIPLLVPGVGAQGGDLAQILKAGRDSQGQGLMINASRSVIYAVGADPQSAARAAAQELVSQMNS